MNLVSKYLIHVAHQSDDCPQKFSAVIQAGAHYLTHAEWGCAFGVHEGWAVVKAESLDDANLMVPPILRKTARVVQISRLTPRQIWDTHAGELVRINERLAVAQA
jgi:hypothetical protein